MSPLTHLLASWIFAAHATDNARDRRLVALAGLAPDLDGLGLVADVVRNMIQNTEGFPLYQTYHHWLMHGWAGGLAIGCLCAALGRQRARVFWSALLVFHLHLFCDLLGSRGPELGDLWPIHYFGPFSQSPMWLWRGQWRLDGWQNQLITVLLLVWTFRLAVQQGFSVVSVFSSRADATFVATLRKWAADWKASPQSYRS